MAIYCVKNRLPGIAQTDNGWHKKEHIFRQTKLIKQSATVDDICNGIPKQFKVALNYIKKLKYDEKLNYAY